MERERVDVYTFISRMIQHVFPKGVKRIRYYGVQATKTFEKVKGLIQEALSKVKGIVKGAKYRGPGQFMRGDRLCRGTLRKNVWMTLLWLTHRDGPAYADDQRGEVDAASA